MLNKDVYTKLFLELGNEIVNDDAIKKFKNIWWYNIRSKNIGGLRLTDVGLEYLNSIDIRKYEIDFPKKTKLTPQLLVYLDKFINCPYHINNSTVIVTEEKTALELHLFSGDILKMGYAKTLAKRLNSFSTNDKNNTNK
jgi:hypothetical protein